MPEYIITAAAVIAALIIADILIETRIFRVRKYTVHGSEFSKNEKDVKIIVLADLHNRSYGKENKRLIEAIDRAEPDIIIAAGDLLVAKPGREFTVPLDLLAKLSERYPIYYGIGNHEYRLRIYPEKYGTMYEDYMERIKAMGIHVLENRRETIMLGNTPVDIWGLEIDKKYYKRFHDEPMEQGYIESLIGRKDDRYTILIAHNPCYFREYADWGADLVFAGHIHGGIARLPFIGGVASPQVRLFPEYDGGLFEKDRHKMILSRGLGTHTINIRFNNPAELVLVTLKGKA